MWTLMCNRMLKYRIKCNGRIRFEGNRPHWESGTCPILEVGPKRGAKKLPDFWSRSGDESDNFESKGTLSKFEKVGSIKSGKKVPCCKFLHYEEWESIQIWPFYPTNTWLSGTYIFRTRWRPYSTIGAEWGWGSSCLFVISFRGNWINFQMLQYARPLPQEWEMCLSFSKSTKT
jgi:hypothetical protein